MVIKYLYTQCLRRDKSWGQLNKNTSLALIKTLHTKWDRSFTKPCLQKNQDNSTYQKIN